jgi:hypothetical protein
MFETTTGPQARSIPKSKWKVKAGLKTDEHEAEEVREQMIKEETSDEESEEELKEISDE